MSQGDNELFYFLDLLILSIPTISKLKSIVNLFTKSNKENIPFLS